MSHILLPKRYHPDFRYPDVKPKGKVEIDWSHSDSHKLLHAFFVNQNTIDLYDTVQKVWAIPNATTNLSIVATDKGLATSNSTTAGTEWWDIAAANEITDASR